MTYAFPRRGTTLLGIVVLALPLFAQGARAQAVTPGTTNGMLTGPVVGPATQQGRKPAPPPALPGARTTSDPAPADRPASDMHPNEALFDAINRGDIVAARDAIGRGADPRATNVLGLTPVELAVDLGRNDITFLLLSLRGGGGGGGAGPASVEHAGKSAPVRAAQGPKAPARPAPHAAPVVARAIAAPSPRQYADVPGTPVPQAGFLGFGGVAR